MQGAKGALTASVGHPGLLQHRRACQFCSQVCLQHMLCYAVLCCVQGCHGGRPVTLIGCSMGARLVFHCLLELSRLGLRGCVENVILLGAPLSCRCVCLVCWGVGVGRPQQREGMASTRACDGPTHPVCIVAPGLAVKRAALGVKMLGLHTPHAVLCCRPDRWCAARSVVAGRLINGYR